ncbi:MAG: glycerol-3-phosphate dehydrogenase [Cyanobacteria bacterium P01_G01_bin.4]
MFDLHAIQAETYDVIVIGGGINGAGVARDAAARGLRTIVIEKGDFGSGTTSWSTRLIHGGLRYLEYFEFPLVRESLKEREVLLRNAPHLVKPIQLTVPVYRSGSHKGWEIEAGMVLYDILSYDKSLPNHRRLGLKECSRLLPSLSTDGLTGAVQYYDAQVEYAERLCLEVIQAAEQSGATVLNYCEAIEVQQQERTISAVRVRDVITGDEFSIPAGPNTIVVNTSGPWLDRVCERGTEAGESKPLSDRRLVGGTKGSHIFVESFPGAPDTALYVEAQDGRPYFVVPWLGGYLIGTTDFRYEGDLDRIKIDDDEIDYLIDATNKVIPTAQLTRADVQFTYSGVRPLPYREGKSAGAITRKHIILDHRNNGGTQNLISLIGGKLTTHRNSSQEIVDMVCKRLGKSVAPCRTATTPLPGAISFSDPIRSYTIDRYRDRLPARSIEHLFMLYGNKAPAVLALADEEFALFDPIIDGLPDIKAQVVYAVSHEYARTITDIVNRRTSLSVLSNFGYDSVGRVAGVLVRYCNWDRETCIDQVREHAVYVQDNCVPDYIAGDRRYLSQILQTT